MKNIQSPNESPEWDSSLLKDLDYIKRNLRYPISGITLALNVAAALVLAGLLMTISFLFYLFTNSSHSWRMLPSTLISMIPACVLIPRLIGQTRFLSVETGKGLDDNIKLLRQFLEAQRLITFRNPHAPEVFQILSRNINAFKEQREVLIFIADDQRILINSHFTSDRSKFQIRTGARHHREMGDMLRQWIIKHAPAQDQSGRSGTILKYP